MKKEAMQDILPPKEQRTIRRIPLNRSSSKQQPAPERPVEDTSSGGEMKPPSITPKRRLPKSLKIWGAVFVVLIVVIFFGLISRSGASVTVEPRMLSYDLDLSLTAYKNGSPSFQIFKTSKEAEKTLTASGEREVERAASGEIIIFNEHSANPQALIKNTRFETPEGLIYRINESITVPGAKSENGKLIPGQLKVRVYADSPGETYNIGLTDFTIPGFKGLPQFENFFARSATPMTGGFVGTMKTVEDNLLNSTESELRGELEGMISNVEQTEVPEGFVLLNSTLKTNFESLPQEEAGNSVKIRERATVSGIMVKKDELERAIAENVLSESSEIDIPNLSSLNYQIEDTSENLENLESVEIQINGKGNIVWVVDSEALKNDLVGKSKKNLTDILSNYKSVEKAEATISPFWKGSFPKNTEKIEIEISRTQ